MFSPNTNILLSNKAALGPYLAEPSGSGAVSLQVPPASSISVLSRNNVKLLPPVTRRT